MMYLSYLPHTRCKCVQYLLQIRQLQLLRRHVNIGAKPPIRDRSEMVTWSMQSLHKPYHSNMKRYFSADSGSSKHHQMLSSEDDLENSDTINMQSDLSPQLGTAQSADELFALIDDNPLHLMQCISALWIYYQRLTSSEMEALKDRIQRQLLPNLDQHIGTMDVNDLSCCYLYLRKMHVPNSNTTLEEILTRALHIIDMEQESSLVPLPALSRLLVGINLERDFFTPLVCRNFIPHLEQHITHCQSEQEVRLLSTCMFQLHPLIDKELLDMYKARVEKLLQDSVLSSSTPKALLKSLHMLNLPVWSHLNTELIRKVLLELRTCLAHLESNDLKTVCRTFLHHQEPASLLQPLKAATEALLQRETNVDSLACTAPFAELHQRDAYIRQFRDLLQSKSAWEVPNASGHFFSVLRALKIADVRCCDAYWLAVVNELETKPEVQTNQRFLRHCQRYMNFNNNLGGTYRFIKLERLLSRMCFDAIENDVAGRLPSKFGHLAAFVIAYGHTPFAWKKFPNILLSKILTMTPQFDIKDCFLLSRGIQIASELRFRQHLPPLMAMQLSTMDSVLISCSERHLAASEQQPLNANELSVIVRTLSHRKSE